MQNVLSLYVMNNHCPIYNPVKGSSTIAIFIHGIVESPNQFLPLMNEVRGLGVAVASLLLPGHGGSGEDFARSNKREWVEWVKNEVDRYRSIYSKIILVGHSMGGLLSILNYANCADKIEGIIAIDTPLRVRVKLQAIKNYLKIGLKLRLAEDDSAQVLLQSKGVDDCSIFTYMRWLPRMIDLYRLMRETKRKLRQVAVPILAIQACRDEVVSLKSVKIFEQSISPEYLEVLWLNDSTHFAVSKNDTEKYYSRIKAFCSKIG